MEYLFNELIDGLCFLSLFIMLAGSKGIDYCNKDFEHRQRLQIIFKCIALFGIGLMIYALFWLAQAPWGAILLFLGIFGLTLFIGYRNQKKVRKQKLKAAIQIFLSDSNGKILKIERGYCMKCHSKIPEDQPICFECAKKLAELSNSL
jgi:hypothetical protein